MKKLALVLALVGGLMIRAQAQKAAEKPVMMAAGDLKWDPFPGTKGMIATVSGDPMKSAHTAFVKIPAGEDHPLHTHSATLKVVVISGTWLTGAEGEKPKSYGPGSYLLVPANMKHTSGCDKSGPCEIFQQGDGAMDMKPVEAAKKPAAKK